jgi:ABC-type Na+ efflux pump permease subunit
MVIASREYQAAVRSKAFFISLVLMPVLVFGGIAIQGALKGHVDLSDRNIAISDRSGVLFDALAAAVEKRNQSEITDPKTGAQSRPRFVLEWVAAGERDPLSLALEQSDRVRRNEIFAFVDIGPGILNPRANPERAEVHYYSNTPTYEEFREWMHRPINETVRTLRCRERQIDPQVVADVTAPVSVQSLNLIKVDPLSGQIKPAERSSEAVAILVPMGLMMLMFMVVMVAAPPLLQSVLEEKMQRIAEVLLGSVTPFELMMGKLIGMVGVSLTIVTVYAFGSYMAAKRTGYVDLIPFRLAGWFVAYQLLAVLMFGSVFISIGAAVTDARDAQSMVTPAMLLLVMPMFVWFIVLREPMSQLSTMLSLFPPATPMLMVLRAAAAPNLPLWQPLLGMVLVLLTTVLFVFAAGRIFRVGILMQGKGARLGDMLRWVISG